MKVTVLIPSWNSGAFIQRALRSVLNNGYDNIEVRIMDNNSTDETSKIVSDLQDPRVIFFSQKDSGMYEALNRGIRAAEGSIICWLGADDQLMPGAIQSAVDAFQDQSVEWVVGEGVFLFENNTIERQVHHQLPSSLTTKQILQGNPLISPSVFFRKALFEKVGAFNERYRLAADYALWLAFAQQSSPFVLRKPLSIFSFNGANESSKNKIKMYRETLDILRNTHNSGLEVSRMKNILRMHVYILGNKLFNLLGVRKSA